MKVQHIRGLAVLAVTGAAIGGGVALAQGGTTPPTIAYAIDSGAPTSATTQAQPGPTTFTFSTSSAKERDWGVGRVDDGVDPAKVQQEIDTSITPDQLDAFTSSDFKLVAGGAAFKGRPAKVTLDLTPGTYIVVNSTNHKRTPSTTLTVTGDPNGATAPAPASTVTMRDYRFSLSKRLPRSGVIRFHNAGKRNHMAIALKAADAAGQKKLVAALKKGDEKAADKLIRGDGASMDVISPGATADLTGRYGKGRYVFVCFYGSKASGNKPHFLKGMVKPFQVK